MNKVISFRTNKELTAELNAYKQKLEKEIGVEFSLSQVIIMLLKKGMKR